MNPKLGSAYAILVRIALRDQDLDTACHASESALGSRRTLAIWSCSVCALPNGFWRMIAQGSKPAKQAVFLRANPQYSRLYSIVWGNSQTGSTVTTKSYA